MSEPQPTPSTTTPSSATSSGDLPPATPAVRKVGILGSGIMGAGLAEVAARAGFDVVVRSRSQASADAMVTTFNAIVVELSKLYVAN